MSTTTGFKPGDKVFTGQRPATDSAVEDRSAEAAAIWGAGAQIMKDFHAHKERWVWVEWLIKFTGCFVIPVTPKKVPAVKWKQYQTTPPTPALIREWFLRKFPDHNASILTHSSGWVGVDPDSDDGLDFAEYAIAARYPPAFAIETRRGKHLYYPVDKSAPESKVIRQRLQGHVPPRPAQSNAAGQIVENATDQILLKIDIKALGGYLVAAGSVHAEDSHVYRFVDAIPQSLGGECQPNGRPFDMEHPNPEAKPLPEEPFKELCFCGLPQEHGPDGKILPNGKKLCNASSMGLFRKTTDIAGVHIPRDASGRRLDIIPISDLGSDEHREARGKARKMLRRFEGSCGGSRHKALLYAAYFMIVDVLLPEAEARLALEQLNSTFLPPYTPEEARFEKLIKDAHGGHNLPGCKLERNNPKAILRRTVGGEGDIFEWNPQAESLAVIGDAKIPPRPSSAPTATSTTPSKITPIAKTTSPVQQIQYKPSTTTLTIPHLENERLGRAPTAAPSSRSSAPIPASPPASAPAIATPAPKAPRAAELLKHLTGIVSPSASTTTETPAHNTTKRWGPAASAEVPSYLPAGYDPYKPMTFGRHEHEVGEGPSDDDAGGMPAWAEYDGEGPEADAGCPDYDADIFNNGMSMGTVFPGVAKKEIVPRSMWSKDGILRRFARMQNLTDKVTQRLSYVLDCGKVLLEGHCMTHGLDHRKSMACERTALCPYCATQRAKILGRHIRDTWPKYGAQGNWNRLTMVCVRLPGSIGKGIVNESERFDLSLAKDRLDALRKGPFEDYISSGFKRSNRWVLGATRLAFFIGESFEATIKTMAKSLRKTACGLGMIDPTKEVDEKDWTHASIVVTGGFCTPEEAAKEFEAVWTEPARLFHELLEQRDFENLAVFPWLHDDGVCRRTDGSRKSGAGDMTTLPWLSDEKIREDASKESRAERFGVDFQHCSRILTEPGKSPTPCMKPLYYAAVDATDGERLGTYAEGSSPWKIKKSAAHLCAAKHDFKARCCDAAHAGEMTKSFAAPIATTAPATGPAIPPVPAIQSSMHFSPASTIT